jgi:biopolymer transport protein ExbB
MHLILRARVFRPVAAMALFLIAAPVYAQTDAAGVGAAAATVERQSFLDIVWRGSGWLGPIIGVLSLVSVTFIIEHFWTTRRATIIPEDEPKMVREMIEKRQFKECVDAVSKSRTMFGDVLTMGLRHGRHGFEAMQEAVEERANAWRAKLFRKIEYLNIIGNISPLLGLLGTVVGMIEAFGRMGQGGYGPDELADGISIALVSTFLGLNVAIVSMLFFGICRNRADSLTIAAHAAVVDILEYFRPALVAPQPAAAPPRPAGAAASSSIGAPGATSPRGPSPAGVSPLPLSAFPAPAAAAAMAPANGEGPAVDLASAFGAASAPAPNSAPSAWPGGGQRDNSAADAGPAFPQPAGPG